MGDENEWLVQFCKEQLKIKHTDYFIFGHRHLPIEKPIENSLYINLGDWIKYNTYAVFDGQQLKLKIFKTDI
jgi:UDP-2,3-diacylglucosamine hydrolase